MAKQLSATDYLVTSDLGMKIVCKYQTSCQSVLAGRDTLNEEVAIDKLISVGALCYLGDIVTLIHSNKYNH